MILEDIINHVLLYFTGADLYILNNINKSIKNTIQLKYISPSRLTFIQQNTCTICDNICNNTEDIYISLCNLLGWVTCTKCLVNIKYSHYLYTLYTKTILCNYIYNFNTISDSNLNLQFFRRSINKIQKNNKLFCVDNQNITYNKDLNVIGILLKWNTTGEELFRQVSIINLIYHNRSIFHYNIDDFIFKFNSNLDPITTYNINKMIKKQYDIVNQYYYLQLVLLKYNIHLDNNCLKIIQEYFFNFI